MDRCSGFTRDLVNLVNPVILLTKAVDSVLAGHALNVRYFMRFEQDSRSLTPGHIILQTRSIEAAKPQRFVLINLFTHRTSFHGGPFHQLEPQSDTKPTLIREKRDADGSL